MRHQESGPREVERAMKRIPWNDSLPPCLLHPQYMYEMQARDRRQSTLFVHLLLFCQDPAQTLRSPGNLTSAVGRFLCAADPGLYPGEQDTPQALQNESPDSLGTPIRHTPQQEK